MPASPSSLPSELRAAQKSARETQNSVGPAPEIRRAALTAQLAAQNFHRGAQSIYCAPQNIVTRRRSCVPPAALAGLFLLIAIGVSSCGAPKPIRFYQLNPPALAPASGETPYPVTLVLGAIS